MRSHWTTAALPRLACWLRVRWPDATRIRANAEESAAGYGRAGRGCAARGARRRRAPPVSSQRDSRAAPAPPPRSSSTGSAGSRSEPVQAGSSRHATVRRVSRRRSAPRGARAAEYRRPEVAGRAPSCRSSSLTALSSETATVETPVRARLKQAIAVDGVTVLPAGPSCPAPSPKSSRRAASRAARASCLAFTEVTVDGATRKAADQPDHRSRAKPARVRTRPRSAPAPASAR